MTLSIRPYRQDDFAAVALLWRRARLEAFPEFQRTKGHTFGEDRVYLRDEILPNNQVWVAELDGKCAGFMAQRGNFIDQLYVDPAYQHQGVGRAFLAKARQLSPASLRLFTFQSNRQGRAFYEKSGFRPVKFGLSPPPENEPDVEYQWP
jgi:ribosomal protein S18 acetylase RimI-like enzyme